MIDTNVLVASLYEGAEHFSAARSLLHRAAAQAAGFCITPQVAAEFYATVTNPRRVTDPRTPQEAVGAFTAIMRQTGLEVLPVPADIVERLFDLVDRRPVRGGKVYDLQLVATMLGNDVRRIFTFNIDDFLPFSELEVLRPTEP